MPLDQDLAPEYLKRKTPPVEAMPEEVFLETGGVGTSPFAAPPPPAATDPLASGIPGAPLAQQPPFTLQTGATPPVGPPTTPAAGPPPIVPSGFRGTEVAEQPPPVPAPAVSTGQQISDFLAGIGLKGIRPVAPVQGLVDAMYGQDPAKETNPVYRTLQRLAPLVDTALTALNVPITGVGDIANVIFAPLTIGLRQAGLPEEQVQQFVESTRVVPELAAGLGMGAPGALGTLGKVGNLEGMSAEVVRLMGQAERQAVATSRSAQAIVDDVVAGKLAAPLLKTEAGVAHKDALVVVSRAIAGATAGSFVGDTWDERAKNALIGMGVGAAASPALVKRIAKAAKAVHQETAPARSIEESAAIRATESLDPMGAVVQPATPHVTPLPATERMRSQFLEAIGDALPSTSGGDLPGGLPPKLIQVNWATIRSQADVDAALAAIVRMRPPEARVITQEESRAAARELGLTTQQMVDMAETVGGDAAQVQAMKDLVVAARNKTVEMANQLDAMVEHAPGYTELDAAFRQQLGVFAALTAKLLNRASEMGRAFNMLKGLPQEVGDTAQILAMAGKNLKGVPTETLIAQVKTLPPQSLPAYFDRLLSAGEVSVQTASWAYLNSLLMTFEGATANLLGNLTVMAENPLLKAGAAGIGTAREGIARLLGYDGEISRVYHGESFATLLGNLIGVPEAMVAAGQIVKTGESRFGGIAKETPRFKPTGEHAQSVMGRVPSVVRGLAGFTPDTYSDAAIRLATTLIELPNRVLLMAPDEFAKVLNYRGSTWSQAYNQVEKEFAGQPFAPLRSQAAADRFLEIIRNPDAAMRQIATGKTESVGDVATRSANVNTLNEPLGGRLGSLAEGLSHPLVRMTVAPFFKVPVNLFRMNVEHVPVLGLAVKRAREDWAAGGAQRDLLLAKWALGGGLMSFAAVHALTGDLTGGGPRDPALKKEWLDAGFQSYGWQIGDKMISYTRFDVLGSLVGMTAAYVELRPYMRPDEADQIGSAMILAVADNMLSKTFVRSASEWLQLLMSRDPKDLSTNKLLRSFAGGFVPSGVAQIERKQDPALRAVYSLLDEVASRVPGYSKHLFPRLNWLTGKPQVAPQGWAPEWLPGWVSVFSPIKVTEVTKDPVVRELLDHEIGIAALPPYIYGSNPEAPLRKPDATQGIPLSPEQHYWYQRLAATTEIKGKTLKDALESLIQSPTYQRLTDGPHGSKADAIHGLVTGYRDKARMELIEKYPDLAQEWREKIIEQGVLKGGEALRPRLEKSTEGMLRSLTR